MDASVLAPRARTVTGLIAMAGLSQFLLAPMAFLPVPVRDPGQSKLDSALRGVWHAQDDVDSAIVWVSLTGDQPVCLAILATTTILIAVRRAQPMRAGRAPTHIGP